jgi:hypothetical protein
MMSSDRYGMATAYFKVPRQHLPGEFEEIHKKLG